VTAGPPNGFEPHTGGAHAEPMPAADTDQRSLGDIVGDIAEDLSTLLKQEVDLAKTELKQEAAKAGKGAGLLGGAGVAGHLVLVFLSLTLMFLLDNWMPIELAALIVAAVWGIAAAVMGLMGKKALQQTNPQLPKTQQTLKEDAAWARAQKS
jgi:uncharacterized membrane protein YqjE